jgi:serine/threonine protein phosphatase PrpC
MINDNPRRFRYRKRLEALVRSGRQAPDFHKSCGDALLIDPQYNFYAVADNPAHNPTASARFLRKFRKMIDDTARRAGSFGWGNRDQQARLIASATNSLLETIDYNDNTTYTGIFIITTHDSDKIFTLHAGDSLLYHFRIEDDIAEKITHTNHCFIGRSNRIYQTALFDFHPDSRLLLATDGLYDLFRKRGDSASGQLEMKIMDIMKRQPVHCAAQEIINQHDAPSPYHDDLALATVAPSNCIAECRPPVFL